MGKANRNKAERRLHTKNMEPVRMESVWKRLGIHPVVPVVVGAAMTLDGSGNIAVKSYAILACAGWLCIDLWTIFRERISRQQWRPILYCTTCALIGLASIWPAYWLLGQHFEEEQRQVMQYLIADVTISPQMNPMDSSFTVSNPAGIPIGQHNMMCYANLITRKKPLTGKLRMPFLTNILVASRFFKTELSGDRGQQTYDCLSGFFANLSRADYGCLDITIIFDYVLEDQPELSRTKYFRFVSKDDQDFMWKPENIDDPTEFCGTYALADPHSFIVSPPLIPRNRGFYLTRPQ